MRTWLWTGLWEEGYCHALVEDDELGLTLSIHDGGVDAFPYVAQGPTDPDWLELPRARGRT